MLVSVRTPARVKRLSDAFCIVFASSWGPDAPRFIAPLVGLSDDTPFVPFNRDLGPESSDTWKLAFVQHFIRRNPSAWLDDELGIDAFTWASKRAEPTLLIETDPRHGLLDHHVSVLLAFAERARLSTEN